MRPYPFGDGKGRSHLWNGHLFTVKAGHEETEGGLAFMEFITRKGEEPPIDIRRDEDLLKGSLTVTCGDETLHVDKHGFVFLPRNIPHGYTISSEGYVRMLVVTTPAGFGETIEKDGTRAAPSAVQERLQALRGSE